ncbi:MAG: 16S rRNA (cytidine(1402)-2'-O)-methyltransferase [Lachnospiraceae bacterium]|jgi:16S rRNA (cytidine1402-2'-O)-methyltransferase|nr:16S rRNA (cytidine(1402)-2'-O)-methyltransferase [Lachnospiraceae bacterium]
MSGILYLCATPIGNLGDLGERVGETLRAVDFIAAEDTRHSLRLLNHLGVKKPLVSFHEHNRHEKADYIIARLKEGDNVALLCDAGTPTISDPGYELVARCQAEGLAVTALPGPCALIAALSLSGLSPRRFCFEGFLPAAKKERRLILAELASERRTIVLYEAPHRLTKTLGDLLAALGGERRLTVCRELTKKFEEVRPTTIAAALLHCQENPPRGEYVLVLAGAEEEKERTPKVHVNKYKKGD